MKVIFEYKVATLCCTYNQSPYIAQTLEGFVNQHTNFPVLYIVLDDASKDGEQVLLKQWANEHLVENENGKRWETLPYGEKCYSCLNDNSQVYFCILLLNRNYYQTGENALKMSYVLDLIYDSKYFAFCEGDDFWSNPDKLKKQVEYLDSHPDCNLCYGVSRCYHQQSMKYSSQNEGGPYEDFNLIIKKNTIPTPTTLLRTSMYKKYYQEINPDARSWKMGDYPIWLYLSHEGTVKFMNEVFAVYRVLNESASHSGDEQRKEEFVYSTFEIVKFFADYFGRPDLYNENALKHALFRNAFQYGNKERANEIYSEIVNPTNKEKVKHFLIQNKLLYNMFKGVLFNS